jgi:hypothetical protein
MNGVSALSFQTPSRQLAPPVVSVTVNPAEMDAVATVDAVTPVATCRTFAPARPTLTSAMMAALIEAQALAA